MITCVSHTAAHRHPQVLGQIGGWTLPMPITFTQIGVAFAALMLLRLGAPLWAHFGAANPLIAAGLVIGAAAAARRTRIEGRQPFRALAGLLDLSAAPRLRSPRSMRISLDPHIAAEAPR